MGDDEQRLAGMRLGDFRQRGAHSGGEAHQALAAGRGVIGPAGEIMLVFFPVARLDVRVGEAVPQAVVFSRRSGRSWILRPRASAWGAAVAMARRRSLL